MKKMRSSFKRSCRKLYYEFLSFLMLPVCFVIAVVATIYKWKITADTLPDGTYKYYYFEERNGRRYFHVLGTCYRLNTKTRR